MSEVFQTVLGVVTGLGLAAACGFRVFVPLLVASIAVRAGAVEVAPDFLWIGSTPAIVCLSAATLLEIGGYFIPGVDHFLDVVATPAAVVAGTLLAASFITDMAPWFRWSLAAVAGGGIAAAVQTATVVVRAKSGLLTLGLANPIVAGAELVGSTALALMAALAPLLALLVVGLFFALIWSLLKRRTPARVEEWASPPS